MKTLLLTIILTIASSVTAAVNAPSESVYTDKILMAVAEPVSSFLPLNQPTW